MRNMIFTLLTIVVAANVLAETTYLDQGWNEEQRDEFYFTAQGSQLIPYEWFLAVEQTEAEALFRDEQNMLRYGFLTAKVTPRNPDGLPIGFVKDGVDPVASDLAALAADQESLIKAATRFQIKQAYLGSASQERLYPQEQQAWFGLTCAACHTHEIEHEGTTIRIDGGSMQANIESFLIDLAAALQFTCTNPEKLQRFAARVGRVDADLAIFKDEVKQIADAVSRMVVRNKAQYPYGYARLDAFGAILNAVCETALNDPRNRLESNAPVSFPSLWNTPHMGYVQWGATADFAEGRNVGEVLGVFGCFSLDPGVDQFDSTVRLQNLVKLEHQLLANLRALGWPAEVLGELDVDRVEWGRKLFAQNCQSCHPIRDQNGEFALNDAGRIPIRSSLAPEVRTDPQFLLNLAPTNVAWTGVLKPLLGDQDQVPRTLLLRTVVEQIMKRKAMEERVDLVGLMPGPQDPPHPNGTGYIARPLEGIWATAPYFHNGSVPNLYETLLPAAERSKSFWVGTRTFDPVRVGFATAPSTIGSEFHVVDGDNHPIPGNANVGHDGHGNNENEGFTQTFENGTWRDFTDEERYALVEYMKSLSSQPAGDSVAVGLEQIPADEADRIANIVELTAQQMQRRYPAGERTLRGVHPKDHGCVKATFEVWPHLPAEYSVGVFQPGARYDAYVRFSNAAGRVGPDSRRDESGTPIHGSRGMAVKLMGVAGESLLPLQGELSQDFVMVNQPAFAFANVEDYELLSQVLLDNDDQPQNFFVERLTNGSPEQKQRALRTKAIAERIAASAVNGDTGAFAQPPPSPVDAPYFSAAPFLFGDGRVMKFRVKPVTRSLEPPDVDDPDYLRKGLIRRLAYETVIFDFAVQVREASELNIARDIEDASTMWDDDYVSVALITILPQEFDSPAQREECERLFFTPWHGVTSHRPLGGINRLRKAVYEASLNQRRPGSQPGSPK